MMFASMAQSPALNANKNFRLALLFLCLLYFVGQLFFIRYAMLSVDEFWFAHHIYQYKSGIPYRDFIPYKNVLGYYLLLFPLSLSHTLLNSFFYIKDMQALINVAFLAGTALWLRRFFPEKAILMSLALIACAHFFLVCSTNIRVDLLAYWVCLVALLLIFENKFIWAGLCLGISFLISPKTVWYIFATNCALGCDWLFFTPTRVKLKRIVLFNFSMLLVLMSYIGFWSLLSNTHIVLHTMFYDAYVMAALDWYSIAHHVFWQSILTNDALLFLLWPLTLMSLLISSPQEAWNRRRVFILIYSWTILLLLITYKQPFSYNMMAGIPAFFLLYTDFFAWLYALFYRPDTTNAPSFNKTLLWGMLFFYSLVLVFLNLAFALPPADLLICFIPLLFGMSIQCTLSENKKIFFTLMLITFLFTGVIYPLVRFAILVPYVNGKYQQAMVLLTDKLTANEGGYVAGVPLIYNKDQPVMGLRHLMGPALAYLHHPTEKLRPVMSLTSLYVAPVTAEQVIESLTTAPVKLYVNNFRMDGLPDNIKHYLTANYAHFWGSVYLYAPEVPAGQQVVLIKFAGDYVVDSGEKVTLDDNTVLPGNTIRLAQGKHTSTANAVYRLKFVPEMTLSLDPHNQKDDWENMTY
jgi:hypothetical protein